MRVSDTSWLHLFLNTQCITHKQFPLFCIRFLIPSRQYLIDGDRIMFWLPDPVMFNLQENVYWLSAPPPYPLLLSEHITACCSIKSRERMCKSFDLTILLLCLRLWCLNWGICTDVNLSFSYFWINPKYPKQILNKMDDNA